MVIDSTRLPGTIIGISGSPFGRHHPGTRPHAPDKRQGSAGVCEARSPKRAEGIGASYERMPTLTSVRDTAIIHAPLDRVWALSRRVELVKDTLGMKLVGGTTSGFVESGSRVVWRGWKFGLPTEHHTLITGFEAPHELHDGRREAWFQDSQEKGRFATFQHDHWMRETHTPEGPAVTMLEDHVQFSLPLFIGGQIVSTLLMKPYVKALVKRRFRALREIAEGHGWERFV